jgi:hypothetical protein
MAMTKSKLQMEYNKKVTSSAPGLLYVFFGSFVRDQRFGKDNFEPTTPFLSDQKNLISSLNFVG